MSAPFLFFFLILPLPYFASSLHRFSALRFARCTRRADRSPAHLQKRIQCFLRTATLALGLLIRANSDLLAGRRMAVELWHQQSHHSALPSGRWVGGSARRTDPIIRRPPGCRQGLAESSIAGGLDLLVLLLLTSGRYHSAGLRIRIPSVVPYRIWHRPSIICFFFFRAPPPSGRLTCWL